MYGYNNTMPPPWMWPSQPSAAPLSNPAEQITGWIKSLEELKKHFKEGDKKDDPKKKGQDVSVISMMLFMLLIAPITGPAMFHFFQLTINMMR